MSMNKLPKRTTPQAIGEIAAELLNAVITKFCNVIPVTQSRDLGIDFICELMQGDYPTEKLFNLQCKGTEETQTKGDSIKVPIFVKTINYWLLQPNPTFLFIVDCENRIFYWCFPESLIIH